jgi:serine-type D-Ala-D-Ala carboxypeptidase/endopeptidase (penicillin-binding protein 4)
LTNFRNNSLRLAFGVCALVALVPEHGRAGQSVSNNPPLQLQQSLDAAIAQPALEHATWGIVVRSLVNGETLYSLNPHRLLMPASNMKIVTLAAAAERLGWNFSYETRLVAVGTIDRGVLTGDLVVVGGGDPNLDDWDGNAPRLFASWAKTLKASGISIVNGRIVGDDNFIEDNWLGFGWQWDDLDQGFASGIAALIFNENTVKVTIAPGPEESAPARVTLGSESSGLTIRNSTRTSASSVPSSLETRRLAGSRVLEVRGTLPLGGGARTINAAVFNPTLYYVSALRAALIANGIEVRGEAVDIDDTSPLPVDSGRLILSYYSPALPVLATTMMKLSQNLFAESLMYSTGADAARTIFEGWGIPKEELLIADGSGLSRYNLVTPEAMATILTHVARSDRLREGFLASLPIAGRDGSLENRMKGTPAEGNARAKTGSFTNARALSGYVRSADGELLAFTIIANNYNVPAALIDQTTDSIVVRLAQFKRSESR